MNNRTSLDGFKRISLGVGVHSHSFSGRPLIRQWVGNDLVEAYATPNADIALVVYSPNPPSPHVRFSLYHDIAALRSRSSLPETVITSIVMAFEEWASHD